MTLLAAILTTILIGAIAGYVGSGIGKAIDQLKILRQEKHNENRS